MDFLNILKGKEMKRNYLKYTPNEIVMAAKIYEKLISTLEIACFLMKRDGQQDFLILLLSAKKVNVEKLLETEKRDTDFIVTIDENKNLYALICQDTKVKGGYVFGERLLRNIVLDGGTDIYCTQLDVRTINYKVKDVLFYLIDIFSKSKRDMRSGEIIFGSLH